MRRYIERHVEDKLAHMFISNEIAPGSNVVVDEQDGIIIVKTK